MTDKACPDCQGCPVKDHEFNRWIESTVWLVLVSIHLNGHKRSSTERPCGASRALALQGVQEVIAMIEDKGNATAANAVEATIGWAAKRMLEAAPC